MIEGLDHLSAEPKPEATAKASERNDRDRPPLVRHLGNYPSQRHA